MEQGEQGEQASGSWEWGHPMRFSPGSIGWAPGQPAVYGSETNGLRPREELWGPRDCAYVEDVISTIYTPLPLTPPTPAGTEASPLHVA